jgi:hypothetical protein
VGRPRATVREGTRHLVRGGMQNTPTQQDDVGPGGSVRENESVRLYVRGWWEVVLSFLRRCCCGRSDAPGGRPPVRCAGTHAARRVARVCCGGGVSVSRSRRRRVPCAVCRVHETRKRMLHRTRDACTRARCRGSNVSAAAGTAEGAPHGWPAARWQALRRAVRTGTVPGRPSSVVRLRSCAHARALRPRARPRTRARRSRVTS